MNFELIRFIAECVICLALVVYYLVKIIKNKWVSEILDTIKLAVAEAEAKWPIGHGTEKKEYVLEKVKVKCEELKIPFDLIYKLIVKVINNIVDGYNSIKKSNGQ